MNLSQKYKVKNKNIEIKGFSHHTLVTEPSPLIGGHQGGVVTYILALVEYEDGTFEKVRLDEIQGFFKKRTGE